jgi:cob(I)alamin adenosyltransferase
VHLSHNEEPVAEIAIKYLNRLSDYLFLWRLENCPLMSLNVMESNQQTANPM